MTHHPTHPLINPIISPDPQCVCCFQFGIEWFKEHHSFLHDLKLNFGYEKPLDALEKHWQLQGPSIYPNRFCHLIGLYGQYDQTTPKVPIVVDDDRHGYAFNISDIKANIVRIETIMKNDQKTLNKNCSSS